MLSFDFFVAQLLNGVQFGIMLFLIAAGLTLVLGIMNLINLAHGSLYMIGAYLGATFIVQTGSFLIGTVAAIVGTVAIALLLEELVLRKLYKAPHLHQVLGTFGVVLFLNEVARIIWGSGAQFIPTPYFLKGQIVLFGDVVYPVYRITIIAIGLSVAALLYVMITYTRIGMLIRAGASNRDMAAALGININRLLTVVFGLGAALAALAGLLLGPLLSIQPGAGDPIVITALVVLVIGGIGSIRGAFFSALLIGIVDTLGRSFLPLLFQFVFSTSVANTAAPIIASLLIYLLMTVILVARPQGLFPARIG